MTAPDILRYLAILIFGAGCGLMVATNVVAFNVLRPPQRLGFLWWHVTAISFSFLLLGSVCIAEVWNRIGDPARWQTYATFTGITLFLVAQIIIFGVERSRLTSKRALEQAGISSEDVVYDPATREVATRESRPTSSDPKGGASCGD